LIKFDLDVEPLIKYYQVMYLNLLLMSIHNTHWI